MSLTRSFQILVIVAHPDDESLWVGGTLTALSQMQQVNMHVMVMTGRNHEYRYNEFLKATDHLDLNTRLVLDLPIPNKGGTPLENTEQKMEVGLSQIGVSLDEWDLIISHGFNGDEHIHYQHRQLFHKCRRFCFSNDIPFASFSCMPIPYLQYTPFLTDFRRGYGLHFLTFAKCEVSRSNSLRHLMEIPPKYFVQLKVDGEKKNKMLEAYQSIDIAQHRRGYASWDSEIEHFYLFDDRAKAVFSFVYDSIQAPFKGAPAIF